MPRREHRHRLRSPPVPREDAHRSASSEFDSDDEEQRAPPLLKRNDGNSGDDSDEDMDEDSDEDSDEKSRFEGRPSRFEGHRHRSMSLPDPRDGVRRLAPMDLDSDDDDTIVPTLFKKYDSDSDDESDDESEFNSDEDSDDSGCDGTISSCDDDDVMHDLESLVYLQDGLVVVEVAPLSDSVGMDT